MTQAKPLQITLAELFELSPDYKKFFSSKPKIKPWWDNPWTVWLQRERDGRWSRRQFDNYVKAHNFIVRGLKDHTIHDAALACGGAETRRPLVIVGEKPARTDSGKILRQNGKVIMVPKRAYLAMPEDHRWCPYCRRPTRWGFFPKGHPAIRAAFGGRNTRPIDDELRCRICGVRASFVIKHHT